MLLHLHVQPEMKTKDVIDAFVSAHPEFDPGKRSR